MPPLSGNSTVVIFQVTDINEYPPEFSEREYSAITLSSAPSGTRLLQVTASDGDGEDNVITYGIINQEMDSLNFTIDSNGVIYNDQPFLQFLEFPQVMQSFVVIIFQLMIITQFLLGN